MFIKAERITEVEGMGEKSKGKIVEYFKNADKGKLPSYLNQRQKDEILLFGAILSGANTYKNEYIEHDNNKTLLEYLEMIEYASDRFINTMTSQLNDKQKKNVVSYARSFKIDFKPKKEFVKMYEEEEHKENVIILSEEQGDTLFELTQASCSVCTTSGEGCKFKELLVDMGVKVLNQHPEASECPFRYAKKTGSVKK